jgi:hypothetical protein
MGTKLKRLLAGSAALACAALAACGTATVGSGAPLSVAVDKGTNPQQQAKADAAAMLAAFVPPPGATRLSSAPASSGGILKHKAFTAGADDQLDDVSFWRVPASAGSVLAFEKAHLPHQFTLSSWGSVGDTFATPTPPKPGHPITSSFQPRPIGNAYGAWLDSWTLPLVPGVIALRELTVEVTDPSSSVTYVRVDSNVAWIPARPASDKVPAGVTVVTITASPNMNHPEGTPAPVTVTDPAKVATIVALLDGLSLNTSGVHGCPAEEGKGITLSFRAKPNGPVLAAASEPIPSCGSVTFTIGGVQQPGLADWGTFASKVLAIAGVHWPSWYI